MIAGETVGTVDRSEDSNRTQRRRSSSRSAAAARAAAAAAAAAATQAGGHPVSTEDSGSKSTNTATSVSEPASASASMPSAFVSTEASEATSAGATTAKSHSQAQPAAQPPPRRFVLRGNQASAPCRSVQWYVAFSGASDMVEVKETDLGAGDNLMAEFVHKHPTGEVPALEEDEGRGKLFCLSESSAILRYLSRSDNEMQQTVSTRAQRARLDEYVARHLSEVRRVTTHVVQPYLLAAPHVADGVLADAARILPKLLGPFEAALEQQKYVLSSDSITLADFLFATEVDQLRMLNVLDPLTFPNIISYLQRLASVRGYSDSASACEDVLLRITSSKAKRVDSIRKRSSLLLSSSQDRACGAEVVLRGHPVSCPCRSVQWYVSYRKLDDPLSEPAVKLWGSGTGSALRKRVVMVPTHILDGDTQTDAFLARHPEGQVPALEDGGFNLDESVAILLYLSWEDTMLHPRFMDRFGRANLSAYFAEHLSEVRKVSSLCFKPIIFAAADDRAAVLSAGAELIAPILQRYDAAFAAEGASPYVLGDSLSLADFMFAPEIDQLLFLNLLRPYPGLLAYLVRMQKVPGYATSFDAAKKGIESFTEKK